MEYDCLDHHVCRDLQFKCDFLIQSFCLNKPFSTYVIFHSVLHCMFTYKWGGNNFHRKLNLIQNNSVSVSTPPQNCWMRCKWIPLLSPQNGWGRCVGIHHTKLRPWQLPLSDKWLTTAPHAGIEPMTFFAVRLWGGSASNWATVPPDAQTPSAPERLLAVHYPPSSTLMSFLVHSHTEQKKCSWVSYSTVYSKYYSV